MFHFKVFAILLFLVFCMGCGDDFAPLNELTDHPRVLGLRASPTSPSLGDEVLLEALTWVPEGRSSLLRWSWCPLPVEDKSCAVTHDEFQPMLGVDVPSFDLGEGEVARFSHTIPVDVLQAICDGSLPGFSVSNCGQGFPLQIRLEVDMGTETEIATKILFLPLGASTPNQNPMIPDHLIIEQGDETLTLRSDERLEVLSNASLSLRFPVQEEASEVLPPPSVEREHLILSWYVEGGSTKFTRTAWLPEESTLESVQSNIWSTPSARTETQLYLVLRDGRGGTSWQSFTLDLVDAP